MAYYHNEADMKLKDYEDAEEQGLLIRLPCRVGHTLYEVDDCGRTKRIRSFVVNGFKIYETNRIEIYFENASGFTLCDFSGNLDEGWFLTREVAEAALERMGVKMTKKVKDITFEEFAKW